ncbi:MAG TPA: hypothetical protein VEA16_06445 [Vicinamibacterales bacterium]|nr:hypothetical protein [Vicinamibacterales bacterium]
MKRSTFGLVALAFALVGAGVLLAQSVTKVYLKPGGNEMVLASGGKITVESGGEIELQSGAILDTQAGATLRAPVSAKTADYTVATTDFGKVLTTRGAGGAVTFTLPAAASAHAGAFVYFLNAVDQNMTIAATAGEVITFNDLAANSVAFSTAGNKIGAFAIAVSDGTSWYVTGVGAHTATVAT